MSQPWTAQPLALVYWACPVCGAKAGITDHSWLNAMNWLFGGDNGLTIDDFSYAWPELEALVERHEANHQAAITKAPEEAHDHPRT